MKLITTIKYEVTITLTSGLHIGAGDVGIEIGGTDSPVIKDQNGFPYIPGSSLKGKLRSLYELANGKVEKDGSIHKLWPDCQDCAVCRAFGVSGVVKDADIKGRYPDKKDDKDFIQAQIKNAEDLRLKIGPTRMLVQGDLMLEENEWKPKYEAAFKSLESPYELKTEVSIDRGTGTSKAGLRTIERVPSGAVFTGTIIFRVFEERDKAIAAELFETNGGELKQLLEADYLGGQGSRGSGAVVISFTKK
jgi:CRISPR-associated protein Csm3